MSDIAVPGEPSRVCDPATPDRSAGQSGSPPPVLLLQGWLGSGPGHWQRHWMQLRPDWQVVDFGSWQQPDPLGWHQALADAVSACERPPLLIAHSLGCLAAASLMARAADQDKAEVQAAATAPPIAAALLVAPPDPGRPDTPAALRPFHPVARQRFGVPGQLLLSSDDPYASEAYALELAGAWGLEPLRLGPLGHVNADSGLGAWPEGLALAEALLERLSAEG